MRSILLIALMTVGCKNKGDIASVDSGNIDDTDNGNGTDTNTDDTGGADDTAAPDLAPYVMGANPYADSGVRNDTTVLIEFSAPMDTASVEAAFQSDLGDVAFTWAESDTLLTVTPISPLAYVIWTDPSDAPEPNTYTYQITTDARGADGQPILEALNGSFDTGRLIVWDIGLNPALSGRVTTDGEVQAYYSVGDTLNDVGMVAYTTFDLGHVPPPIELMSATFTIDNTSKLGSPFENLSALGICDTSYDSLLTVDPEQDCFPFAVLALEFVQSTTLEADVRSQVDNALDGTKQVQFSVRHGFLTDEDNNIDVTFLENPALSIRALVE